MKVKVNVELIMNIPGEFQDDHAAVGIIDQVLRDQLYVGVDIRDYEDDIDVFPIEELAVRSYFVLAGRIANKD